jgi:hypothetical protein
MTQEEARREIGAIANSLLRNALSYIEGARKIAGLRFFAGLENDLDITPFVGIDSETDDLPLGESREHWQPQALARLQPKIDRAEVWARELSHPYCNRLAARFHDEHSSLGETAG